MKYILKNPCRELGFTAASITEEFLPLEKMFVYTLRTEGERKFNIPFANLKTAMNYFELEIQSKPKPEWEMKPIFEMEYMGKLCSYQAGCNLTTITGSRRVRRFPTPRVDNFKKSIYYTALAKKNHLVNRDKFPLTGRLSIEVILIYSRRIDLDNITKIIYDALQGVVYVDDFQLKKRLSETDDTKGKPEGFILKVFQI